MTNDTKYEYNHTTGEAVITTMTDAEQTQKDANESAYAIQQAQQEADKAAAKAAALAKLEALGLTTDDLKALGL